MSTYRVAVVIVSDTASSDSTQDKSGPAIQDILINASGYSFQVEPPVIVPDDVSAIQRVVKSWTLGDSYDWIITSGGTGFGARDLTPEAISPLLERPASGLVHLIMAESLKHTPLAALSRPVAGTIRNTLVVTLPGSPKAVKENLNTLLSGGVIGHALDLLTGGKESAKVHAKLGVSPRNPKETTVTTTTTITTRIHTAIKFRPHGPHYLMTLACQRNRVSPYPLISMDEAMKLVLDIAQPLESVTLDVNSSLAGHVLSEDITSSQEIPATPTTNVDGYAVQDSIYRINTGAPLPPGTNAVIMVEDTRVDSEFTASEGQEGEEKTVELLAEVDVGENVRKAGSDVHAGDRVLFAGDVITSLGGEIGTLAFVGRKQVTAYRKPVIALLSTGNELVDLQNDAVQNNTEHWAGIWDTNRPSLKAALEGLGYQVVDLGIVHDTIDAHLVAMKACLIKADVLITTGGTSMGASDLLKPLLERHLNGTIHFGRVAMKPGKPTTFATVPSSMSGERDRLVFGLPGNPASALVTFYLFVLPALRRLGGWKRETAELPRLPVEASDHLGR
ncbi:molybdopterin-binding domain protein [Ceratobasidium sp. AG-Ba]|nr:molybdopterin-binding domain protein [Ceratobasidium sp. AG-Ba]